MWAISKSFKDPLVTRGQTSIHLNYNSVMSPYHISYPITWTGIINGEDVEIIQKDESSKYINDYEFVKFPANLSHLKGEIVELIDDHLRIID